RIAFRGNRPGAVGAVRLVQPSLESTRSAYPAVVEPGRDPALVASEQSPCLPAPVQGPVRGRRHQGQNGHGLLLLHVTSRLDLTAPGRSSCLYRSNHCPPGWYRDQEESVQDVLPCPRAGEIADPTRAESSTTGPRLVNGVNAVGDRCFLQHSV